MGLSDFAVFSNLLMGVKGGSGIEKVPVVNSNVLYRLYAGVFPLFSLREEAG